MRTARRERGFTLLVGLIMLILMTLFAVSAFQLGKSSLQIVGNMQQRNQVLAAAQGAIEVALSKRLFFMTPSSIFTTSCGGANKICFDTNSSGKNDILVEMTPPPSCIKAKTVKNANLNITNPADFGCAVGVKQTGGIEGSTSGDSLCSDSLWELRAVATDSVTKATATITQGVAVRVSTDNIAASCP